MKKIVLSIAAVSMIGSNLIAGGDIAPVTTVVEAIPSNFYAGVAYTYTEAQVVGDNTAQTAFNDSYDQTMLQLGYKYNEYLSFEARYWIGWDETMYANNTINKDASADSYGIFLKPTYPIYEGLEVYGLLGYSSTDYDLSNTSLSDQDGFAWGLGLEYTFSNNIGIFADYANLGHDDSDDYTETYNFGVNYKF
jgi:opacity protein-like surface antigen